RLERPSLAPQGFDRKLPAGPCREIALEVPEGLRRGPRLERQCSERHFGRVCLCRAREATGELCIRLHGSAQIAAASRQARLREQSGAGVDDGVSVTLRERSRAERASRSL